MKNKETIEQIVAKIKIVLANKFIYRILDKIVIKRILQPKYHVSYDIKDDINKEEGPCFLVYNHSSRSDYIWITQSISPRRANFVTGYNEFFRSKFKGIFDILHQIPKKNFTNDMICMKGMKRVIDKGGIVAFSPEGMSCVNGHNQPVVPGTGKLFKHYNIPVYCLHISGGFLTNHKVCLDDRPGKVEVTFFKLFTKEDTQTLTPEEMDRKLDVALWNDDYEWNKEHHYKFKTKGNACDHMHDLLYKCPRCGAEFKMIGEKDTIKCLECGNGATLNDYYELKPLDDTCVIPESPSKWDDWERSVVIKEIKNPEFKMEFDCGIGELPKYKYLKDPMTGVPCGSGHVLINHEGFHFKGTRDGKPFEFTLAWPNLYSLLYVTDMTYFQTYVDGEYIEFYPKNAIVGKTRLVVEEMHRYHGGKWQNFPWMEHLYKDEE